MSERDVEFSNSEEQKKVIRAWTFYDWANSSFALVIASSIFPIFYTEVTGGDDSLVDFFGAKLSNTELVSYISAFAFLLISISTPILSGIADYAGNKLGFLKFFCFLGGTATIGLTFFAEMSLEAGMTVYLIAMIGFWSSLVFYNAYLPEIAPPEQHDKISARGFSMGYFGSAILLITCLALWMSDTMPIQYAFTLTGIWWIGFSFLTYPKLPKSKPRDTPSNSGIIWSGFKELLKVWHELKKTVRLKRYLMSFFIYSMGIQTIMIMATYFGANEINWTDTDAATQGLIISILLIQFVAIAGAYLCSWISSKIGNIKALAVVLVLWIIICLSALFVYEPIHFYCIAGAVGLVMGGIQSLSRSTYSKFLPKTKDTSSYFSFYDVCEKVGIAVGTLSYGLIEGITGSMRDSIFALIIFFAVGLILLFKVPKEEVEFERETI